MSQAVMRPALALTAASAACKGSGLGLLLGVRVSPKHHLGRMIVAQAQGVRDVPGCDAAGAGASAACKGSGVRVAVRCEG